MEGTSSCKGLSHLLLDVRHKLPIQLGCLDFPSSMGLCRDEMYFAVEDFILGFAFLNNIALFSDSLAVHGFRRSHEPCVQ